MNEERTIAGLEGERGKAPFSGKKGKPPLRLKGKRGAYLRKHPARAKKKKRTSSILRQEMSHIFKIGEKKREKEGGIGGGGEGGQGREVSLSL